MEVGETIPPGVARYISPYDYELARLHLARETIRAKFQLFDTFRKFMMERGIETDYEAAHLQNYCLELVRRDYAAPLNSFFAILDMLTAPPIDPRTGRSYTWGSTGGFPARAFKRAEDAVKGALKKRIPSKAPPAYMPPLEEWRAVAVEIRLHLMVWLCTGLRTDSYFEIRAEDVVIDRNAGAIDIEIRKDKVWELEGRTIRVLCNCCSFGEETVRDFCFFHGSDAAPSGSAGGLRFPVDGALMRVALKRLGWQGHTPRRTFAMALRELEGAGHHWHLDVLKTPGWCVWSTFTGYTVGRDKSKRLVPTVGGWRTQLAPQGGKDTSDGRKWPNTHAEAEALQRELKDDMLLKQGGDDTFHLQGVYMSAEQVRDLGLEDEMTDNRGPRAWYAAKSEILVKGGRITAAKSRGAKKGGKLTKQLLKMLAEKNKAAGKAEPKKTAGAAGKTG